MVHKAKKKKKLYWCFSLLAAATITPFVSVMDLNKPADTKTNIFSPVTQDAIQPSPVISNILTPSQQLEKNLNQPNGLTLNMNNPTIGVHDGYKEIDPNLAGRVPREDVFKDFEYVNPYLLTGVFYEKRRFGSILSRDFREKLINYFRQKKEHQNAYKKFAEDTFKKQVLDPTGLDWDENGEIKVVPVKNIVPKFTKNLSNAYINNVVSNTNQYRIVLREPVSNNLEYRNIDVDPNLDFDRKLEIINEHLKGQWLLPIDGSIKTLWKKTNFFEIRLEAYHNQKWEEIDEWNDLDRAEEQPIILITDLDRLLNWYDIRTDDENALLLKKEELTTGIDKLDFAKLNKKIPLSLNLQDFFILGNKIIQGNLMRDYWHNFIDQLSYVSSLQHNSQGNLEHSYLAMYLKNATSKDYVSFFTNGWIQLKEKVLNNAFVANVLKLATFKVILGAGWFDTALTLKRPPVWYSEFLPFLSKQFKIDPTFGASAQKNEQKKGVYNKEDESKVELKFAFKNEFANLINEIDIYNALISPKLSNKSKVHPMRNVMDQVVENVNSDWNKNPRNVINSELLESDKIFLDNFYNFKYSGEEINSLLQVRAKPQTAADYSSLVSKTSNLIPKLYENVFKAPLKNLRKGKNWEESGELTSRVLLDLPTIVSQVLANKTISADVNYGVPEKNVKVDIWSEKGFNKIPLYPKDSSYLNLNNTLDNKLKLTLSNFHFSSASFSDDNTKFPLASFETVLSDFNEKYPNQNTLKTIQIDNPDATVFNFDEVPRKQIALQYELNYRENYSHYNLSSNESGVALPEINAIPVIDPNNGTALDYKKLEPEKNIIENTIDNYFSLINPKNYKPGNGFRVTTKLRPKEILDGKDEALKVALKKVQENNKLNFEPDNYNGVFYYVVSLANAYNLGSLQRDEHPANFMWYLGDGNVKSVSFYLLRFEAPTKIYSISDLKYDAKEKQLYLTNKNINFAKYTASLNNSAKQDERFLFSINGEPLMANNSNGMYSVWNYSINKNVVFKKPDQNPKIEANAVADLLTTTYPSLGIGFKDNYITYNENNTISIYVSSVNPSSLEFESENAIEDAQPENLLHEAENNKNVNGYWKINLKDTATQTSGSWLVPYKKTDLSNNTEKYEILFDKSPDAANLKIILLSKKHNLLNKFIDQLNQLFVKKGISNKISENAEKTLQYQEKQDTIPFFQTKALDENASGDNKNPASDIGKITELSSGAKIGLGVALPTLAIAMFITGIVIYRKKNSNLIKLTKKTKSKGKK
ncbi:hypothetical protein [[Mycoplasma] testudinis]|uniref:hypothetical protein n=1 Tax=[Mycoplasma] testudinis TaxID=33924 RepID=UPI00048244D5|nr:hypothetical protein [[Mycoplasma] testudinis]